MRRCLGRLRIKGGDDALGGSIGKSRIGISMAETVNSETQLINANDTLKALDGGTEDLHPIGGVGIR